MVKKLEQTRKGNKKTLMDGPRRQSQARERKKRNRSSDRGRRRGKGAEDRSGRTEGAFMSRRRCAPSVSVGDIRDSGFDV